MNQIPPAAPRTYAVRTLGCQMNEHDSERMAGLLEAAGLVPVDLVPEAAARATDAGDQGADVVVINTCSVRENAARRLFGNLGQLASVLQARYLVEISSYSRVRGLPISLSELEVDLIAEIDAFQEEN